MVGVDIERHLAEHEQQIKGAAWNYTKYWAGYYDKENADDVEQAFILRMIEAHESGAYDHVKGEELEHGLWSYVKPALRLIAFDALNPYLHYRVKGREDYGADQSTKYGPLVEVLPTHDEEGEPSLEDLQEARRDRGAGDGAKVEAINWYWSGHEEQPSTLTPEEQKLVEKLRVNLTDEELTILDASVGRSDQQASDYLKRVKGMKISKTTYWRRLKEAQAKAKDLAQG
jgi:predicted DNA-binding protein (UPF0251 family)